MSYELKVDPKRRAAARFISKVRKALVLAAIDEKKESGISQNQVAKTLGVDKSAISRMLTGESNLTLRSIAEFAWAIGWEPDFTMKKTVERPLCNDAFGAVGMDPMKSKVVASAHRVNVRVFDHAHRPQAHSTEATVSR